MFNLFGIALQVLAALYMVVQAWRTARVLAQPKYEQITINNLEMIVGQIASEVKGQFRHQLAGFVVLAIGAAMQAVAAQN